MLTADLVDARKKEGELLLRPLDRDGRTLALEHATTLLDIAQAFVGRRREELESAWDDAVNDVAPKHVKMIAGLRKLAADACSFEADESIDPIHLRRVVFTHASEVRRALGRGQTFDRAAVIAEATRPLGIEASSVERSLFSDLRSEHVLRAAPILDASSLVETWELGQAQAVLLTAVRVTIEVTAASSGLARTFFAKLKFHQLLFSAERTDRGFCVVIDGPYSMFDAVTKYGLKLSFLLPALRALEHWSLVADVKWGKTREALVFRLSSGTTSTGREAPSKKADDLHLSDDVRELAAAINALESGWKARPETVLLDVPGLGVCIPDLALRRKGDRTPIYVEILGYWSRDAVFRRVELAERGLGARVVFAVSSRLRVSAEVLDASVPSSLYVYKGKMSPRAVVDHATRVASRET